MLQYTLEFSSVAGTDLTVPALPDTADPEVQVWRNHDGTVCAYGHTVSKVHWIHLPGLVSFCFGGSVEGVAAVAQPPIREDLILDVYRRVVLPMALQTRGQEVLHASAVLTSRGVVALCARSGTGKSTTAFGLSQRGWPLWADDAVAFEMLGTGIRAVPLPFGLRLLSDAARFFNQDLTSVSTILSQNGADQIERKPELLSALLLLKRAPGASGKAVIQIRQLSSAKTLTEVLAHAYCFNFQDVERNRSMMHHYLGLVSQVPVFEICFQPGLETLPAVLDGIERLMLNTLGVTCPKRA
jgi:hypothetical protein